MPHDLVLRNGAVFDGLGHAPVRADVAIDSDRITAIGAVAGRGAREIDATGRWLRRIGCRSAACAE